MTLEPLVTAAELVTPEPVLQGSWSVSATEQHPMAMLLCRERGKERSLDVVELSGAEPRPVPIDAASTGVLVDDHGTTLRVLTQKVVEGERVLTQLTSSDLTTWASVDVSPGIDRPLAAAGTGLVASMPTGGAVMVWAVDDAGAVTLLGTAALGEDRSWEVRGIGRVDQVNVLLLVSDPGDLSVRSAVLRSIDGGATWTGPEPLPGDGSGHRGLDFCVVEGTFLVTGENGVVPGWSPGVTYERPTAWSSGDGVVFTPEQVPLPTWESEGFSFPVRGDVEAGQEIDFLDVAAGPPVRSADGSQVSVAAHLGDICRAATRSGAGEWSLSEEFAYAGARIDRCVAGPDGWIGSSLTGAHRWSRESDTVETVATFSDARELRQTSGGGSAAYLGVVEWEDELHHRGGSALRWGSSDRTALLRVDGERLEPDPDVPLLERDLEDVTVHQVPDGPLFLSGAPIDGDGPFSEGLVVVVRTEDGAWEQAAGIPATGDVVVGTAAQSDGRLYLPLGDWSRGEDEVSRVAPRVLVSEDALTWEDSGDMDLEGIPDGRADGGGFLCTLAVAGDRLLGAGWVRTIGGEVTAATARFDEGIWTWSIADDPSPGSSFTTDDPRPLEGSVVVQGWLDERTVHVALSAEGDAEESYRSTDEERRDVAIDLGDGALLAAGWVRGRMTTDPSAVGPRGYGSCLWGSRDGGKTWDVTPIPGQEGRFPRVALQRDGEDVLVLVDDPGAPHAYRILGVRSELLDEDSA